MKHKIKNEKNNSNQQSRGLQIAVALMLIVLLFFSTMNNEVLYSLLGNFWLKTFKFMGISSHSFTLSQPSNTIGLVTNRPRNTSAILSYSVLYLGMCLAILCLLLPSIAQRKLVFIFYGLATSTFLVLLLVAKLGISVGIELSNQLIHFIVSPLPVVVLFPLLKWYLPNKRLVV